MTRKVADCRQFPSEVGCTLTISGEEKEVMDAAAMHAVAVHGEKDTPEFREQLRTFLVDEKESVSH
jgi:predicted small metal-binding protein